MSNIRNLEVYENSFWDWTPYNSCFGDTMIRISDVDGIVERKGKFLFLETKRPDELLTIGQRRLHDALRETGLFWVLVIRGERNTPINYSLRIKGMPEEKKNVTGEDEIKKVVQKWFKWADIKQKTPTRSKKK